MSVFTKENPFRVIWKIKNFSFNSDECIESSKFKTHISVEEEWIMTYEQKFSSSENSLKLICREYNGEKKQVTNFSFKFEIIGIAGDGLASEVRMNTVEKGEFFEWRHKNPLEMNSDTGKEITQFVPEDCLTFQFSMWGNFSEKIGITRIVLCSEIEVENCTLMWILRNFSACKSNSKLIIFPRNDVFKISLMNDDEIKIVICKARKVKANSIQEKILRCRICLLDSSGRERDFSVHENYFEKDEKTWEFPTFLKKVKLTSEKNTFLANDVLSLHCTFALSTEIVKNSIAEYHYGNFIKISAAEDCPDKEHLWESTKVNASVNMLQKDLQLLYTSRKMTDVTIRIGGKTLLAHKCVLAGRSPVFAAMFEQDMLEKKNGNVEILDIDYDIFDTVLMFMYGATLQDFNCERARKLMIAADKYQILSLKEECSIFLKSIISDETVCDILTLSDVVQDERLIASSVEHIKSNAKNIVQSEEWKQLAKTNTRLAAEVLTRLVLDN